MKDIFVTGIDTDIGKTVASAILTEALSYDYWKPIQCGNIESSDRKTVASLLINQTSQIHPESYIFEKAVSPHIAARPGKIQIKNIQRPVTQNRLVIEGAGGVLVPLNDEHYVIDLAQKFSCDVILVSKNYIGSINHTLLTLETLKNRGISVIGLIFNGDENKEIEDTILKKCSVPKLLHIHQEKTMNQGIVHKYAELLKESLKANHHTSFPFMASRF